MSTDYSADHIGLPTDTSIPVFVYGFLKPDELSYPIVQHAVQRTKAAQVGGSLRIRDGLPLLTINGGGSVEGFILFGGADLYVPICEFEPRKQYRWASIKTTEGDEANALIGIRAETGSIALDRNSFHSRSDLLLVEGPRAVCLALDRSRRGDEVLRFFDVQMAYMLLWSTIERFTALRYGPWLDPSERVRRLGTDPAWKIAIESIPVGTAAETTRRVVDSRDPGTTYRLDPKNPLLSLKYFYQFRCNLTHRGKAAMIEAIRLQHAADILIQCVKSVWKQNGIEWGGGEPAA